MTFGPAEQQLHQLRARRNAYHSQKCNARAAVKTYLDKCMQSSKFPTWSTKQRWAYIKLQRESKLQSREDQGRGTTRQQYPDLHEEEVDLWWYWNQYRLILGCDGETFEELESSDEERPGVDEGKLLDASGRRADTLAIYCGRDSDDDDEELMPIKSELAFDLDDEEPSPALSHDMDVQSTFRRDSLFDHMPPRTSAMKTIKTEGNERAVEVKEGFAVFRTFSMARLIAESNALSYQPELNQGNVHRVWKYVDGRLIEWPPLFGPGAVSSEPHAQHEGEVEGFDNANSTRNKRKLSEPDVLKAKKIRLHIAE